MRYRLEGNPWERQESLKRYLFRGTPCRVPTKFAFLYSNLLKNWQFFVEIQKHYHASDSSNTNAPVSLQ